MLQPQDRVSEDASNQAEEQHGQRILLPILLLICLHTHQAIGEPLQRFQDRVKPRFAVHVEHTHEIKPHRLRDGRERDDEQNQL
jgi:hypothetical protein